MSHPDKTLMADPVVFVQCGKKHVAFVMRVHDDDPHMACLVYYCPVTHAWQEAYNVSFGEKDAEGKCRDEYFVNQGCDCC